MSDVEAWSRPSVKAMDEILGKSFNVLDHGFVRVIDYMGDDLAIVQAARVSYGRGTKQVNVDKGLINYLMRNWHTTPFEMCSLKLHIKLPFFVARQWIRHRTASVNEYSARYSILDKEFFLPDYEMHAAEDYYIPETDDIAYQSSDNKQGRSEAIPTNAAARIRDILYQDALTCYEHYENMLQDDVARELARVNLTLGFYTQWYWKIDLHNLLHFLKLRADPHAQYEIRCYADIIMNTILPLWVPMAYDAFLNYRFNAHNLSADAIKLIKKIIHQEDIADIKSAISRRELHEIAGIFDIKNILEK